MDLHIEAPGHENFTQLESYYRNKMTKRYSAFEFIKSVWLKVTKENAIYTIKIKADLERGPAAFVQADNENENHAFKDIMQKLDHVIRKYKSKHYHGI